jgi:hypothetical protein
MVETKRFHKSVQPCELWDTPHKCYSCACAAAADYQECNGIALALEDAGIDCTVEQTGGMTMVVYVWSEDRTNWISLTNEGMGWVKGDYDEGSFEDFVSFPCEFLDHEHPEGGLQAEHLAEIVRIVKENLWRVGK